jgi:hypothetical protein
MTSKKPMKATSKKPMKAPPRTPKIDRQWRTTIILTVVAGLLSVAVAIEVTTRYF